MHALVWWWWTVAVRGAPLKRPDHLALWQLHSEAVWIKKIACRGDTSAAGRRKTRNFGLDSATTTTESDHNETTSSTLLEDKPVYQQMRWVQCQGGDATN